MIPFSRRLIHATLCTVLKVSLSSHPPFSERVRRRLCSEQVNRNGTDGGGFVVMKEFDTMLRMIPRAVAVRGTRPHDRGESR